MTFYFLAGLPRTGGTLLSSILSQNPLIHAEGYSGLSTLMWDVQESCRYSIQHELRAANRIANQDVIVSALPKLYYHNVHRPHIVDKCATWCLPTHMELIRRYITDDPKVLVLTRDLDEIVESFVRLRIANGWTKNPEHGLRTRGTHPIMIAAEGVEFAKESNSGEFLFIDYHDLVNDINTQLDQIYSFFGLEKYVHDLSNIINPFPSDDRVWGLDGLHHVRPTIGYR
jgi:sulfotransferase